MSNQTGRIHVHLLVARPPIMAKRPAILLFAAESIWGLIKRGRYSKLLRHPLDTMLVAVAIAQLSNIFVL